MRLTYERIWHISDSQGQILDLAFRHFLKKPFMVFLKKTFKRQFLKTFQEFPLRSEAVRQEYGGVLPNYFAEM